jgi:hypothetical protein
VLLRVGVVEHPQPGGEVGPRHGALREHPGAVALEKLPHHQRQDLSRFGKKLALPKLLAKMKSISKKN